MTSLTFVLLCLAVYRVAHMLAREDGPFDVFAKIRGPFAHQQTWLARGLYCVLCLSYWFSAVVAGVMVGSQWLLLLFYWHAIAGGVLIVHKVLK